jgi:hypothetical protein
MAAGHDRALPVIVRGIVARRHTCRGCSLCFADPHGLCYTFENLRFSKGDGETSFSDTAEQVLLTLAIVIASHP